MTDETGKVDIENVSCESAADEQRVVSFADCSEATPEQPAEPAPELAQDPGPDGPDVVEVTGGDVDDTTHEGPGAEESADSAASVIEQTGEDGDDDTMHEPPRAAESGAPGADVVPPTAGDEVDKPAHQSARADESGNPRPEPPSRSLLGPGPVVAGEDPAEFERIIAELEADYPDTGEGDVLRRWQIENAAVKIFAVRRGTRAQRGVWNAAFVDALLRGMVDHAAVEVLKLQRHAGVRQSDEPVESTFRQAWFRRTKSICQAAVAGDAAALEEVVEKLGSDALEIDGAVDYSSLYAVLSAIDRVVRPAQADCDAAFRLLEKQKKRAGTKQKIHKGTPAPGRDVPDLGPSEQTSAPEHAETTTNPPTVFFPKPAGDDDGGA
jgi:hypothetical protein